MSAPEPLWGGAPAGEIWSYDRWSLQVRGDELADIRCDGAIVLRAVRAVSRDRDWQTVWPAVSSRREFGSCLLLELDFLGPGIDLRGRVSVEVDGDRLEVTTKAIARAESWTNRTGLVALHPPRLAGTTLTVGHTDGTTTSTAFPTSISPHQPCRDITSLAWFDHGTALRMDLEGDVFEMEDQRNWSDASFKTYSRSLDEPFPYRLAAGEEIHQRLTLRAGGRSAPARPAEAPRRMALSPGGSFPSIAVGASTAPDPAPEGGDQVAAVQHVELDLTDPSWQAALARARREAEELTVLLVAPRPVGAPDLEPVMRALQGARLRWIGIVDTQTHTSSSELIAALREAMQEAMPSPVPVVGGSRSHFTEVNRRWDDIPWPALEGLVFPTTPLFHVLETEQLVEALSMQRLLAEGVTARAPGLAVHIGPISLRPRFNNVATSSPPPRTRTDLDEGYGAHLTGAADPRQTSSELAAWTIASAAALAVPGVASLTYFESWGPRGIRTAGGEDLPVHDALEALVALQGRELLTSESPDGQVWALGARRGGSVDTLLANLSAQTRSVLVECEGRELARLEMAARSWRRLSP